VRISTRGEYGLRAMLVLAENYNKGPYPLREIAKLEQISEQYLEQLFRKLRKSQLVVSYRGARGGYVLARDPADISVNQVLTALEGPLAPMQCVAENIKDEKCKHRGNCSARVVWEKLKDAINKILDETTLADLIANATEE